MWLKGDICNYAYVLTVKLTYTTYTIMECRTVSTIWFLHEPHKGSSFSSFSSWHSLENWTNSISRFLTFYNISGSYLTLLNLTGKFIYRIKYRIKLYMYNISYQLCHVLSIAAKKIIKRRLVFDLILQTKTNILIRSKCSAWIQIEIWYNIFIILTFTIHIWLKTAPFISESSRFWRDTHTITIFF